MINVLRAINKKVRNSLDIYEIDLLASSVPKLLL